MIWKISDKQHLLNVICAVILFVGLGSALAIYLIAPAESDNGLGYTIVGDTMYPTVPSKSYLRDRELYGGKGLLLADDIMRWFNGLWYGKSLGVTIACLSIVTAGVIYFLNNYVAFEDEAEKKNNE